MADHTAGYAAYTLITETARSKVISPHRRILVAKANLYTQPENEETHGARAAVTLMAVKANRLTRSEKSA